MGVQGAVIAYISGALIFALIGAFILIKHGSITTFFSFYILKKMLYFSLPLVPSSVAIFAQNYIDRIMITNFLSLEKLGIYSCAFQISSVLLLFITAFSMSLTPLIYNEYKKAATPKNIAKTLNIYLFCAFCAGLGLILFLPELFHLFIGKQYYGAYLVIPSLVMSIILSGLYIFTPGLAIRKKTKHIALINIIGMILNFVFNLILIPRYGIQGAAIATILSMLSVSLLYLYISQKYYKIPYFSKHVIIGTALFAIFIFTIPLLDTLYIESIFRLDLYFKIALYSIAVSIFHVCFIKSIGFNIKENIKKLIAR